MFFNIDNMLDCQLDIYIGNQLVQSQQITMPDQMLAAQFRCASKWQVILVPFMWSCDDGKIGMTSMMARPSGMNTNWNIGINRRYGDAIQGF